MAWLITFTFAFGFLSATFHALNKAADFHTKSGVPIVRSWIPWVGSGIHFSRYPIPFLESCRVQYGPIYKFFAGGRYIIVISSTRAIRDFLGNYRRTFGVINYQWYQSISGLPDKARVPHIHSVLDQKVFTAVARHLSNHRLENTSNHFNRALFPLLDDASKGQIHSPLLLQDFVRKSSYYAMCTALFGPKYPAADTCEDFFVFDQGAAQIIKEYPNASPLAKQARARNTLKNTAYLQEFWREEQEGCGTGASEAMAVGIRELRKAGLTDDEIAHTINLFVWGANSNLAQITEWLLAYIVMNPATYSRICQEVRQVLDSKYPDRESVLQISAQDLDGPDFALLTSMVKEVLRLSVLPTSFREAQTDGYIVADDGSTLPVLKGEWVVADIRGMHYSARYHDDAEACKIDRFLYARDKAPTCFTPFGGGRHMCAGRNLAMHTMRMFVIIALYLYDIEPVENARFPMVNPASDMAAAAPLGDPVEIILRRRREY
ncbi:cytochrome P450 [Flammula alnicola]|nr:cytochrome P450 [Flammula alnicola]